MLLDGEMGEGHVQVKAVDDGLVSRLEINGRDARFGEAVSSAVASRPSKSCRHFLGFLRSVPESVGIPDDCAVCPNIVQCYVKRE